MVQSLGRVPCRAWSGESLPVLDFIRSRWVMLGSSCQAKVTIQIIVRGNVGGIFERWSVALMRRFGSLEGKPKAAGCSREGALQQGRNYGLKNRDFPRPAARQPKLPRPWHDAVPSGAVPDIKPTVGGNQGPAVAGFLVEGAQ
jgi:hypothetical protein